MRRFVGAKTFLGAATALVLSVGAADATPFTRTSPTGGPLPAAVTEVGGIVLDLIGANGNRVVTQLAASSLYVGFAGTNPQVIGTQTGFTPAVVSALGGGITSASVRITLEDGDTGPGDFDDNQNFLLLNNIAFGAGGGNFSLVATENTTGTGAAAGGGFSTGFRNNILDTGFFTETDPGDLAALFASLSTGEVQYALDDLDPGENFYDFTQGLDGGLVNVGTGPIVTPPPTGVPEPASMALLGSGLLGLGLLARRRRRG